jgi:hypothetical protein
VGGDRRHRTGGTAGATRQQRVGLAAGGAPDGLGAAGADAGEQAEQQDGGGGDRKATSTADDDLSLPSPRRPSS